MRVLPSDCLARMVQVVSTPATTLELEQEMEEEAGCTGTGARVTVWAEPTAAVPRVRDTVYTMAEVEVVVGVY